MRAIYLVRHGEPDFPDGKKACLGRTDLPLSEKGKRQALLLREYFKDLPFSHVFTSPLKRCVQTAISNAIPKDGLTEVDMGDWDGLSFDEIRSRWPDIYRERGKDLLRCAPPHGESLYACGERSVSALLQIRKEYPAGDLVLFTHSGVIRMLSAFLMGTSLESRLNTQYEYASVAMFLETENAVLSGPVLSCGGAMFPDDLTCEALFSECETPEKVRNHCRAVAEKAMELCDILEEKNIRLNRKAIYAGALLHDIKRTEKDHAAKAAVFLLNRGYASLAAIVGDHMVLPPCEEGLSEKGIVFLADKLIKGTHEVSLEERYFANITEDKKPYVQERYEQAAAQRERIFCAGK